MKKLIYLSLCILYSISASAGKQITLKEALNGSYQAETLDKIKPLADGESFARLSSDKKSILKCSFKTGEQTSTIFDANIVKGSKVEKIDDYIISPCGRYILIQTQTEKIYRHSKKAEYLLYTAQNNTLEQLSAGGKQQEPIFSNDGNQIAFVRDGNIYLIKLLFGKAESQVTSDGKPGEILNGIPDWVNEEEFSTSRSFDFSSDGKMLAWVKYIEKDVPSFSLQLFKGAYPEKSDYATYPGIYEYKYPKAGQRNAAISVHTFDIKSHVTRKLDLPLAEDGYVPRLQFTNTPDQLAVITLNRHQSQMNIFMCNARSLICKSVLEEKNEKYLKEDIYAGFCLIDDHFALISEKSGMKQLYWYSLTGSIAKQISKGDGEVKAFYGYDKITGTFYYQAYDGSPLRTAVFSTNMKGITKKLTGKAGSNSAIFSKNMKYLIHTYSNIMTPPVLTIENNLGKTLKTVITNDALADKLKTADIAQKEFFIMKTSEGIELNGWMMKPVNFNAGKKYPVIMYQYSGPGSQEVQDAWNTGFIDGGLFESYLCSEGFIVVCVDGRGTGGRGSEFEKCTYLHLGEFEAKDQVEAALYLSQLSYIDKDNIGIWGWSYGGFNTLMSMSEGRPAFKAGVAVAPVTDWRFYDTIYAERYMQTPGENAAGYNNNPISRANNLNGHLLICHGLADDNVHFQNTAEYAETLVQADKQFDMQVYTNRNHSIYGGNTRLHLMTRISNFFRSQLMGR